MGLPNLGWTSKGSLITTPNSLSLGGLSFHHNPHTQSLLSFEIREGIVNFINWRVNPMICVLGMVRLALVGWDGQCFPWIL